MSEPIQRDATSGDMAAVAVLYGREVLEGTGQLPKFRDDMFWVLRGGSEDQGEQ